MVQRYLNRNTIIEEFNNKLVSKFNNNPTFDYGLVINNIWYGSKIRFQLSSSMISRIFATDLKTIKLIYDTLKTELIWINKYIPGINNNHNIFENMKRVFIDFIFDNYDGVDTSNIIFVISW